MSTGHIFAKQCQNPCPVQP